jgi:hypothetical protein
MRSVVNALCNVVDQCRPVALEGWHPFNRTINSPEMVLSAETDENDSVVFT